MSNKNTTLTDCVKVIGKATTAVAGELADSYKPLYESIGIFNEILEVGMASLSKSILDGLFEGQKSVATTLYDAIKNVYADSMANLLSGFANALNSVLVGVDVYKTLSELAKSIDVNDIQINEDEKTYKYKGEIFDVPSIAKEIEVCQDEISTVKDRKTAKSFFKRHPVLSFICLSLIIPKSFDIGVDCGTNAFQNNKYAIVSTISQSEQIGTVIVDRAEVRETNNPRSKCVGVVLYSDEVIIIDSIKYWYKIKFTNETGDTLEGYIARKNIDYWSLPFK